MSKRLTCALVTGFLLLMAVHAVAQEEAIGTYLFGDVITIMPAGPDQLAFLRSDDKIPGNPIEMFLYDMQNGKTTRALPGHNFRKDPGYVAAWSPDGSQFVIPGKVEGNWELFIYDRGARSGKPITDLAQYRVDIDEEQRLALGISPEMQLSFAELKFSPSGKRIVFTLSRIGKSAIWYQDLETGNARQITEDRHGYNADLHPDDEHFCYVAMVRKGDDRRSDEDIIWRSIATGVADTIVSTSYHEYACDLSPDGKYLLYSKRIDGINDIYVLNMETGETRQLTHAKAGQSCNLGRWSADGKKIFIVGAGFDPRPGVYYQDFQPF